MRYPTILLIPIGIVAAALTWQTNESGPPAEQVAPQVYSQWCSSCHGPKGRDFIDREWKFGSSEQDIQRIIRDGYPLLGMPGYAETLSADDINTLSAFLLEQAASERGFSPTPPDEIQSTDLRIRVNTLVSGLETPWGMDFVDDTTLLITEREGRLWKLSAGKLHALDGLPNDMHVKGQGGLMDVMHWNDSTSGNEWIYLTYSKNKPGDPDYSATALIRAPWNDQGDSFNNWEELFVAEPYEKTHRHYGSRVAIGGDGKLYLTCGERGMRDVHPQTLSTSPGKVHRFNPDGSIPKDNPFLNEPNARPSIWSWGHRNPQGMIAHPISGEIWTHEHGPKGGDELNVARKGRNYGWPKITFGRNYVGTIITRDTAMVGLQQPIHYWLPSIGPCGMEMVYGGPWPESWQTDLLVGSLSFEYLERVEVESGRVTSRERLLDGFGRVRDIARNAQGEIFVAIEGAGTVLHLEPILSE